MKIVRTFTGRFDNVISDDVTINGHSIQVRIIQIVKKTCRSARRIQNALLAEATLAFTPITDALLVQDPLAIAPEVTYTIILDPETEVTTPVMFGKLSEVVNDVNKLSLPDIHDQDTIERVKKHILAMLNRAEQDAHAAFP
jgi:hypothetical protein